jgi:hypothetical protein
MSPKTPSTATLLLQASSADKTLKVYEGALHGLMVKAH